MKIDVPTVSALVNVVLALLLLASLPAWRYCPPVAMLAAWAYALTAFALYLHVLYTRGVLK